MRVCAHVRSGEGECLWWAIVIYDVVKTTRPSGAKVSVGCQNTGVGGRQWPASTTG